jgi:UDP-glucose 4-epimerase
MRVLVTGGAGFIGSHLVDLLLAEGHRVCVLDDLSKGRLENLAQAHKYVTVHQGSLLDRPLVEQLVEASDATFHLGAAVGVPNILADALAGIRTNVEGTLHVLAACAERSRPLVFASSSEVYGKSARVPMCELDDRVLGATSITRWSYSSSKALGEHAVLEAARRGLPVCVLRYFNAYGPRLAKSGLASVVASFIRSALAGEPLMVHGDGAQTRCFTYVTDTARATAAALHAVDRTGMQIINVGSAREITMRELAERIVRLCGSRSPIECVPYARAFGTGFEDPPRRVPDTTRAKERLGWQPQVELDEGLARTIAWWRA